MAAVALVADPAAANPPLPAAAVVEQLSVVVMAAAVVLVMRISDGAIGNQSSPLYLSSN